MRFHDDDHVYRLRLAYAAVGLGLIALVLSMQEPSVFPITFLAADLLLGVVFWRRWRRPRRSR
ncbi:hypothetical protein [Nocardioides acrostichi]|uniref:Uncharacterized protein n=1 Tax=Nocardioides acrostichi TaxID=2784339 RepID=A0A930Y8T9_9ACTN|nr:hypothetical protein [Nocardioides acrostichi]MBF4163416.1 hypothetical protein [Nocardioides acrostichi]